MCGVEGCLEFFGLLLKLLGDRLVCVVWFGFVILVWVWCGGIVS